MIIKNLLKMFLFPIFILLVHIILIPTGIYETYEWFDIPMHFLGGLSIAISYSKLIKYLEKEKIINKTPVEIFPVFIISFVVLTAVLWEFCEFILDLFLSCLKPIFSKNSKALFLDNSSSKHTPSLS